MPRTKKTASKHYRKGRSYLHRKRIPVAKMSAPTPFRDLFDPVLWSEEEEEEVELDKPEAIVVVKEVVDKVGVIVTSVVSSDDFVEGGHKMDEEMFVSQKTVPFHNGRFVGRVVPQPMYSWDRRYKKPARRELTKRATVDKKHK